MFEYTSDCVLGVEKIDEEHKHLFELVNRIYYILHHNYVPDRYEDVRELLGELEQYADEHFQHEEAYMKQICDAEYHRQKAEHMIFRDKVRDWHFSQMDDLEEQTVLLEDMLQFLAKWLYNHILSSDVMIGKLPALEEWQMRDDPCEYTDEYRTGNSVIDEEHKELFRIMGKINHMVAEGDISNRIDEIKVILDELEVYTKCHFKDEEEYMESIHYENLAAQQRAHEAFISQLDQVDYEEIQKDPQTYVQSLMSFLFGWLSNHILSMDKKIPVQV
jgi:hemerythrin